jgi:hypothetical protein
MDGMSSVGLSAVQGAVDGSIGQAMGILALKKGMNQEAQLVQTMLQSLPPAPAPVHNGDISRLV